MDIERKQQEAIERATAYRQDGSDPVDDLADLLDAIEPEPTYGAIATNAAYIGNVSDGD